ncbi:MAG: nuclear transport factor 2 family protein [Chloroflexota bacterium]|nr:nuclear transport factor 2 family protein [Chloroflexota bacterium]
MTHNGASSPVQVVQFLLDALNRHNVTDFASVADDSIEVTDADGNVTLSGRDALVALYAGHFAAHPALKADLLDRISLGEWVIDETMVSGYADGSQAHIVVIMRVRAGRIVSMRFLRE